jgi:flagellar motor switch/type III secretory pathway protein FliN
MPRIGAISAFPWQALEPLPRAPQAQLRAVRRYLEQALEPGRLAHSLSEVLETPVELVVRAVDNRAPPTSFVRIGLTLAEGAGGWVIGLEPPLASALLASLLRRPAPLLSAEAELDSTLLGALSALFVEAARRSGGTHALRPAAVSASALSDAAIVHATVIVQGKPYSAAAWLPPVFAAPPPERPARALLGELGENELALPLVIGVSLATPRSLSELTLGAAFCPGSKLWVDASGRGHGVLVCGASERGLAVELGYAGEIVLREPTTVALAATEATPMQSDEASDPTLADAVLDAPLVVRVELGQVSMSAREWAALKPGDVLGTGRRLAEPVVLRSGGQVLARGELVSLEGELAVRVLELSPKDRA